MLRRFALLLAAPLILIAAGTPAPSISQVTNAASWRTPGLSASGIAQGSIFTILGNNLGPSSCANPTSLPLPTQWCGVTLTVTVNGTSVAPYIYDMFYGDYISAILPSLTPTGSGTLTVTYNNQTSAAFPVQVVSTAFGTFTANSAGLGQASVTDANYNLNTIIHTLHPGDVAILWGTGLGPISTSDANTPPVGNIGSPTLYVGNTPVTASSGLLYAGRSGSWPGLDQINFTVPQGVQGCYVPIAVSAGGAVGNIGTIAVSAAGTNPCSDSVMGQDLVNKLASGSNASFAYLRLVSINLRFNGLAVSGAFGNGDYARATFSGFTPQSAYYANYGVSSGYCIAGPYDVDDLSIAQLDAGTGLSLSGPLSPPGPITPSSPGSGYYFLLLNQAINKFLFSEEQYTITGPGGADVGTFSVTDTTQIPSAQLTGVTSQSFPRSSDLTLQWTFSNTALQNAPVILGGASFSSDESLVGEFECVVPPGSQKFTVPAWVLSILPPTGTTKQAAETVPNGYVWIGQYNNPTTFNAQGLDRGIITDIFFQGSVVSFQ
jgi:uncharacterized protein (TIGR03437 family)